MYHFCFRTRTIIQCFAAIVAVFPFFDSDRKCHGDLITITNAGFEDISVGTIFNEFSFGAPAGWNLYDPNLVTNGGAGPQFYVGTLDVNPPISFLHEAPEGQRVGIAYNPVGTSGIGEYGLQQTLNETFQSNQHYTLSVEIGNITSGAASNGAFFNLMGFPGYRVELLAGGAVVASDDNLLGGTIPEGEFATSVLEFVSDDSHAQLGQPLSIRLVNLNQIDPMFPGADLEVDFDDVRLSVTAVPEPSALWLMASMFLLSSSTRRRLLPCSAKVVLATNGKSVRKLAPFAERKATLASERRHSQAKSGVRGRTATLAGEIPDCPSHSHFHFYETLSPFYYWSKSCLKRNFKLRRH